MELEAGVGENKSTLFLKVVFRVPYFEQGPSERLEDSEMNGVALFRCTK